MENISEWELEEINQLFYTLENIINEQRHWQIETIIQASEEGMQGAIQAFISMIITNFENSLARFRIYPRYMKKMKSGEIRIHSTTRTAPTENEDITWVLTHPQGEFQKYVICGMNSTTVAIYGEPKTKRTEIPRLHQRWIAFMKAKQKVEMINHLYMSLRKELGVRKTKELFIIRPDFHEELDELFGFLEGMFKIVAYIAIMGCNVYGWTGIILKQDNGYDVVFEDYKELEALEALVAPEKMTEKEYIDLLNYQWKKRTAGTNIEIKMEVDKEKGRLIYKIREKKKPRGKRSKGKKQKSTKLVSGERTVKAEK
ncbi:MAG: hypothetical protein ACTSQE_01690 [Candidatus Heimdallarchaeaceae archaeon]